MRNITVCVTDEIYHHARLCAARRDLTVSAMVRKFFESVREFPHKYYGNGDPYAKPADDTPLPPLFR